jgi:hypothetical protein
MHAFGIVILVLVLIALYWLPTLIAWQRHIPGLGQVIVVNALLGWTCIGWIIALTMSFRAVAQPVRPA